MTFKSRLSAVGPLSLSIKNLRRRIYRTIAVMVCLGLIIGTCFSESLIAQGVQRSLNVGIGRLGADLIVVPEGMEANARAALILGEPASFYMSNNVERLIKGVEGVEFTSSQLFIIFGRRAGCCYVDFFQLIIFDPDTDLMITPWLKRKLGRQLNDDELILGSKLSKIVGNEMMLYDKSFVVAEELETTGMGMDWTVFMPMQTAFEIETAGIKSDQISIVLVKVLRDVSPETVASQIRNNVSSVSVVSTEEMANPIEKHLSSLMEILSIQIGVFWGVSILLVGAIFSMTINERRREIGLLRAMGATRQFIFEMVITEAILLAFLGGLLGIIGGGIAMYNLGLLNTSSLDLPYLWPTLYEISRMTGMSLGMAVLTGLLASLYPAFASSRVEPYYYEKMR